MRKPFINVLIAAVMAVGIAGIVLAQRNTSPGAPSITTSSAPFLEQVAAHATRESCWTVINGNIYDLTSWIPQHPGGEAAILQLCGTDGSAIFNGQHGGSAQQEMILAGFRVAPSTAPVEDDHERNRRGNDDNE